MVYEPPLKADRIAGCVPKRPEAVFSSTGTNDVLLIIQNDTQLGNR